MFEHLSILKTELQLLYPNTIPKKPKVEKRTKKEGFPIAINVKKSAIQTFANSRNYFIIYNKLIKK